RNRFRTEMGLRPERHAKLWRDYPRHLLVTMPSLISTKAVPDFSLELLPPKIRKMAPLESWCSVYLYFQTSLLLSFTSVFSLGSPSVAFTQAAVLLPGSILEKVLSAT